MYFTVNTFTVIVPTLIFLMKLAKCDFCCIKFAMFVRIQVDPECLGIFTKTSNAVIWWYFPVLK